MQVDGMNPQNNNAQQQRQNEKDEYSNELEQADQETQKVKISNRFDPSIDEVNGSEEEDELKQKSSKIKKYAITGIVIIAAFAMSAGGLWGMELYDKFLKSIPIEEVLPGDAEAVLLINLNPDSPQYVLLDEQFKKFPGHGKIMKEFDDVGEGKTLSQFFQDKLKEHGLDFQADIKPVLGETGYVLIPNLKPIESEFQKRFSWLNQGTRSFAKDYFALNDDPEKIAFDLTGQNTRVLGMTSDYFMTADMDTSIESIDFIIASEVKDISEAKQVIEKIRSNTDAYEVSEKDHQGYQYFKVTNLQNDSGEESLVNIKDTYHALVGQNWIMATREEDIKRIVENRKSEHTLTKIIPFRKVEADTFEPLARNDQYQGVLNDLRAQNQDTGSGLITGYYTLNFNDFFKPGQSSDELGTSYTDFFKYPDRLVGGLMIKAQEDGIVFRSTSNQFTLEDTDNILFDEGLVGEIPYQLDNRWADVFFEYDNVKSLYYSFKRNNLTKEGLDTWNETRQGLNAALGIDLERDLVDQLTGALAVAVYTRKGLEPEGVVIADIENKDKVLSTIGKLIELGKQTYSQMSPYAICFDPNVSAELQKDSFCDQLQLDKAQRKILEEQAAQIMNSSLVETQTEFGTIYSYKLPGTSFSFDFGFKDQQVVFGSHYAIVEASLRDLGKNPDASIAKSKEYQLVASNVYPEGYSKVCVNSLGLWNSIEYYAAMLMPDQTQNDRDMMSAMGSIVKTINLFGGADTISKERKDTMSSIYLGIKELPKEEREKAEQFINANW